MKRVSNMTANVKRILILTADSGFGHRSAAEAIQAAFQKDYGDRCEVIVKNPLDHPDVPDFISESQSDYDKLVETMPELYHTAYQFSDAEIPVKFMEGGFVLLLDNILRDMVLKLKPDIIICPYPVFQAPLNTILQTEGLDIPTMTVTTDLVTVHQVYFNDSVTLMTVPSEAVREKALAAGLDESQIIKTGIPVDPEIAALKSIEKEHLREQLGWAPDLVSLLVVGSPRLFDLMDTLQALDQTDHDMQLILVAGGNEALLEKFKERVWRHPVKIYDFVDFMPKLMRAADIVLCKAGGLITTESLASELPIMVVDFIPGQEEGNVNYILDHGAGELCDTPEKAVRTLDMWLEDAGARLSQVRTNAARAGQAEAAMMIAEKAWELVSETASE
jgi:1,2-diacylglycerol 3-beta-galactosyltransferase